jgi:V-type H+-transporting ATPase subunit a
MLIYMFLSPGSVDSGSQLFRGQGPLQIFLLLVALACVPWMLVAKPYIVYREHKKIKGQGYSAIQPRDSQDLDSDVGAEPNGEATHEEMTQDTQVRFNFSRLLQKRVIVLMRTNPDRRIRFR